MAVEQPGAARRTAACRLSGPYGAWRIVRSRLSPWLAGGPSLYRLQFYSWASAYVLAVPHKLDDSFGIASLPGDGTWTQSRGKQC